MKLKIFTAALLVVAISSPAYAISIAVFGDNATDNLINTTFGAGSATLVSDAQLATPGFLTPFDAVYYTRDGDSFGASLSAAAAAQVISYIGTTGNVVLLNADFADDIGSSFTDGLTTNAVSFAAASGHGYIGEFTGSVAALTSNSDGLTALGLVGGAAGPLGLSEGGSDTSIFVTPTGLSHSVTSSLSFPTNPAGVEYGATLTGVDPALVLAVFENGNPAIIATLVPEPSSLILAAFGLIGFTVWGWRRKR